MTAKIVKSCNAAHESELTASSYAEASGLLYTCGGDGKVKVWDKDLGLRNEVQAHEGWIYCIAVNQEGKVYTGSNDGSARVLKDPEHDKETKKLIESREEILSICCDGTRVYAGDDKGAIVCMENENFKSRIETSEACNSIFVEGDLLFSIRDRDLSINVITSRKAVANIAVRACIPGRSPISLFGPLVDGHRKFLAIVEKSGKEFHVYTNDAGKNFTLLAESPKDSHELIIFSIFGIDSTIFTGDYSGKLKKWGLDPGKKNISLVAEIDVCPGVCINTIVATDANTVYVGNSEGVLILVKLSNN